MAGDNRIVAFGASGNEAAETSSAPAQDAPFSQAAGGSTPVPEASETWDEAWIAGEDDSSADGTSPAGHEWLPKVFAGVAAVGWSALFFIGNRDRLLVTPHIEDAPGLFVEWCVPVLLIGVVWLLVMRNAAREGRRFGDVAARLSSESATLEQRLTTVNRELSLAREFIAAQSRDLESLGRIAAERLSENAARLEELVRENGSRVESISTVSHAALENMEKLRSQLPVIASSAKDVTNNIGNAGRTAHAQLEDLIKGFHRLNEFGTASERQVGLFRDQVAETLEGLQTRADQIENQTSARFASLGQRSEQLRSELDRHEVDALAALRSRTAALSVEIESAQASLDTSEAESLTSLRARLAAVRDESEVVARSLRENEERAGTAYSESLIRLREEQERTGQAIDHAQRSALDAMAGRVAALAQEADRIEASLSQRAERIAAETEERQTRQAEQERHAIARIEHMLAELDAAIAERLERHRIQASALAERAQAVTGELDGFDTRIGHIVQHSEDAESRISKSLEALSANLAETRGALTSTSNDVSALTGDSVRLLELLQASARQTQEALPDALSNSEERLQRIERGLAEQLALIGQSQTRGENLAGVIAETSRALDVLVSGLDEGHSRVGQRGNEHAELLDDLQRRLDHLEEHTERTAQHARQELVAAIAALGNGMAEAMGAIDRDAAERIASLASQLGEESAKAIDKAMRTKAAEVSGQLEQTVAHAAGVTRETTSQLRDEMARVEELTGSLESRLEAARLRAEEQVDNDFSRRFALIIESLNSNAIDIAGALSTEVTDTAWAAYLRGDRGIFTRRAVSLLDSSETKAIQHAFERDEHFRDHVNRYIHDFEAILRQILSTRDGNALGVTLLSSDMGKLYVALAQGIERLRS